MTTAEIVSRCRHLNVKLARVGNELEIDAPRGVIDADLRAGLAAHRGEILASLAPPDPLADPIFGRLTEWLHEVIRTSDGECFTDEHGRRWDTLGTAAELYWWTPWSMEWLDRVQDLSAALTRHRKKKGR
jgi:hypothetical protein